MLSLCSNPVISGSYVSIHALNASPEPRGAKVTQPAPWPGEMRILVGLGRAEDRVCDWSHRGCCCLVVSVGCLGWGGLELRCRKQCG